MKIKGLFEKTISFKMKSIIEQYIVAIFAMSKDKGNLIKDNVRYLVKVKSIQENGIS